MSGPRVVYKQHSAATRQSEISALATIYRYLHFESRSARQKALEPTPEPDSNDGSTKLRTQSKEATMT